MSKDIKVEPSEVSTGDDGAREARFFWYYMTTTLTATATAFTTIDTTVSKYTCFFYSKPIFVDHYCLS